MLTLSEIMTREVEVLAPEMTLREAVERLVEGGFSGAPVVSGGRLVGVVSTTDILEFESAAPLPSAYEEGEDPFEGEEGDPDGDGSPLSDYFREVWAGGRGKLERFRPEGSGWDHLSEHRVEEVMTRKIIFLPPETGVMEGARVMSESRIHRLLVARDGELVGIVSSMDLVRAVAEGRLGGADLLRVDLPGIGG